VQPDFFLPLVVKWKRKEIEGRTGKAEWLTWGISQPTQIVKNTKIGDSLPGNALCREGQGCG